MADNKVEPKIACAWSETVWKLECPECKNKFNAPDDECISGAEFQAECPGCGSKFAARAI